MRLMAARYENSLSNAEQLELFRDPENIGVRWSLDAFGVDRIEVTVKARNRFDLYDRYDNHNGQRLAIFSHWHFRPISGFIAEVRPEGAGRVTYVARGAGWRLYNLLDTTPYAPATTISTLIQAVLTNFAPVVASTFSGIVANTNTIGGWQPEQPQGNYPGETIQAMLEKSDSSYRIYDFWLLDQAFNGPYLQKWLPYYQYRQSTAAINWQVTRRDLRELSLSRDIHNIVSDATVYYGLITGTSTSDGTDVSMNDSNMRFQRLGAQAGDKFTNITREASATIREASENQIQHDRMNAIASGTATGGSSTTLVDTGADFVAAGVQRFDVVLNTEDMTVTGTATGGSTTTLVDTGADFVTALVRVGDITQNTADGSTGVVTAVTSATTLTYAGGFTGGTDNQFQAGDTYRIEFTNDATGTVSTGGVATTTLTVSAFAGGRRNNFQAGDSYKVFPSNKQYDLYSIKLEKPASHRAVAASRTPSYWTVQKAEFRSDFNPTQAGHYANALLRDAPSQNQSFTVASKMIKDVYGRRWPLWEVIAQGGGYIRLNDLYPAIALFSESQNDLTVFFITALDYDHKGGTLRVALDNPDRRLDARLRDYGILGTAMIARG